MSLRGSSSKRVVGAKAVEGLKAAGEKIMGIFGKGKGKGKEREVEGREGIEEGMTTRGRIEGYY